MYKVVDAVGAYGQRYITYLRFVDFECGLVEWDLHKLYRVRRQCLLCGVIVKW